VILYMNNIINIITWIVAILVSCLLVPLVIIVVLAYSITIWCPIAIYHLSKYIVAYQDKEEEGYL